MYFKVGVIITVIITSCCYFPFVLLAFPAINSKMVLAAVGVGVVILQMIKKRFAKVPRSFANLIVLSLLVSIAAFISTTYNNTADYAYATYFISMLVWLSAAYVVCCMIKRIHGNVSIELLCRYIIAVCLIQCVIVLLIEFVPAFRHIVNAHFMTGYKTMERLNRLYGIGCLLDVGGSRFAACLLILTAFIKTNYSTFSLGEWVYYISAYIFIAVVGNMVSRTTSVGIFIGLIYMLAAVRPKGYIKNKKKNLNVFITIVGVLVVVTAILIHLYNNVPEVYSLLRFAFEAIFNLFEKGELYTASTNVLKDMILWPDTIKTWVIGDGYFNNPYAVDPFYVGDSPNWGYYMGTDAGYSRFIFYFGLIGLLCFCAFMIYATYTCVTNVPKYSHLFILLLLCNFCVWIKVSTDIFGIIALFVCSSYMSLGNSPRELNDTNENNL